ncbi:MAG: redoxin domain-containing protein [Clostridia bacterium]|nr:redoxin domain-containing protein [Clostridia bacterium]
MVIAIIVVAFLLAAGLIALFVTVQVMWHRAYKKPLPSGEERPKKTFKEWIKSHIPSKRRLIQVYAALLYNANIKGFISGDIYKSETTKYMCVPGLNCYSCPGAVGACPLGAFQNALAESNTKAPYYVLGIIGLFGLTLARTICGFLCPVGLAQDLLYKIRTPKLKKSRVTRVFSYLKYVILAVLVIAIPLAYAVWSTPLPGFCKTICPAGTFGGAVLMLINPNKADQFANLGPLFTWKFCLMVALIAAAIFIYRFFCRFFCPLGAIYGFFNRIALLGVKVDKDNCIECGKCVAVCKMDVKRVGDHECINCGECIAVCPTKAIRWKGSKLFLRGAAVREAALEAEIKPINLAGGEVRVSPETEQTATVQAADATVQEAVNKSDVITAPAGEEVAIETQAEAATKPRKKGTKFWLQLSAWIGALLILIGALVYYNFVDVKKRPIGCEVGDIAPDFTVELYGSDESFNLYENRGKLTVVNFWATWCTGCVKELPHFNELAVNRPDITVLAIHGAPASGVTKFIENKGWSDYKIVFAQDNLEGTTCLTYELLGGTGDWPMTMIVDEDGVVLYNSGMQFESYEQLKELIDSFN